MGRHMLKGEVAKRDGVAAEKATIVSLAVRKPGKVNRGAGVNVATDWRGST